MPFVQVNGFEIQVKQAGRKIDEPGVIANRSTSATLRKHRRSVKTGLSFETIPLTEADAEMVENLLLGQGHYFPLDSDLYSAQKGLGPNAGYACAISATQYKVGSRSMYVASGATGAVWALGYTSDWSFMCWQYRDGAWYHVVVVYDADTTTYTEYVDGAAGSGIHDTWRALIASGSLTLVGKAYNDNASEAVYYDDVVAVPYKLDAETITWHYNSGTGRAFSALPRLSVTGDALKTTTPKTMIANITNQGYVQAVLGGSFAANNRSIQFDLFEV